MESSAITYCSKRMFYPVQWSNIFEDHLETDQTMEQAPSSIRFLVCVMCCLYRHIQCLPIFSIYTFLFGFILFCLCACILCFVLYFMYKQYFFCCYYFFVTNTADDTFILLRLITQLPLSIYLFDFQPQADYLSLLYL